MEHSDDEIVSVPLTAEPLRRDIFGSRAGFEALNGSCGLSIKDTLPILQTYTVSKLVHHSPNLVINMLRILAGPKPDGSTSAVDFNRDVAGNLRKVLKLSFLNTALVHTVREFDSLFIPTVIRGILGDSDEITETAPEADP